MADRTYAHVSPGLVELPHNYGSRVHLVACPVMLTELSELSSASCSTARLTTLVRSLYTALLRHVVAQRWPRVRSDVKTRMHPIHPEAIWHGETLAQNIEAIVVDIARAGTVPAQTCFEALTSWVGEGHLRQDHLAMARIVGEDGQVRGAELGGSKIGGPVENRHLYVPDPMGATGGSIVRALTHYKSLGAYASACVMHLIVTPEYLRNVVSSLPDVDIYALRLDRGLSPAQILESPLGANKELERGLNDHQYIVPGAGGLGELLNHADE